MQDALTLLISPALGFNESAVSVMTPPDGSEALSLRGVRKILLPFDLSSVSVSALRIVTDFAEKTEATIHLLHVVRPSDANPIEPKSSRADDNLAEASERLLNHWVRRIVQGRVKTFVTTRIGEPVDVIVARAIATRADLIVLTSRRCSGPKFDFQRSTAERVSRIAPCAVLTIPEKCSDRIAYAQDSSATDWRTILIPVDFSKVAERSVRTAARIALETGAKLVLAHGGDMAEANEAQLHQRLRTWAARVLEEAVPCQTVIWPGGHSLYAILSEAVRAEANLIVLPTAGRSWSRRLRAGSITDGVLCQAPCPVLCINDNAFNTEE